MKTAISIPDEVFVAAEDLATRLHMSRSELYANALRAYLGEHRHDGVAEQLDRIYATESSVLEPDLARLQSQAIKGEA